MRRVRQAERAREHAKLREQASSARRMRNSLEDPKRVGFSKDEYEDSDFFRKKRASSGKMVRKSEIFPGKICSLRFLDWFLKTERDPRWKNRDRLRKCVCVLVFMTCIRRMHVGLSHFCVLSRHLWLRESRKNWRKKTNGKQEDSAHFSGAATGGCHNNISRCSQDVNVHCSLVITFFALQTEKNGQEWWGQLIN